MKTLTERNIPMIKAGVIGATGYAGAELVRILNSHKEVESLVLCSKSYEGVDFSDIFGDLRNKVDVKCIKPDIEALSSECDVIFTATPQGYLSGVLNEKVLENARVIDLSADYRIKDVAT
ncbi:MAG: N-acetyl-gamma-glutamyl-phosphate reductase, partial [Eubacterium sp.]|nr:N-acetyl-gamma-glutamyl-phosphate reductase [Eubacterium sp.]